MNAHWIIRLVVLLIGLPVVGCTKLATTRPVAGDTVSAQIICPPSWQAGERVILCAKLRVQGSNAGQSRWLTHEDAASHPPPRATFIFWRGDELLKSFEDVSLIPDC